MIAIWWYLSYLPDLEFFFGPNGIIDRKTVGLWRGPNPVFSIFDWPSTTASLWFTYWLGLVVLVLFAAGVFSRITSIAAFVVVVSLIHRGPMLVRPMEDILAMVMLYLCVGPSGAAFSFDRLWKRRIGHQRQVHRSGTVDRREHCAAIDSDSSVLVHFGMAIGQLRDDSWWMGRAMWGFIGKPTSAYVDMTWLADHLYLLNLWTYGVVAFELAFALLIWNRLARPILMAAALVVWTSVGLVSGMLGFALVMLARRWRLCRPIGSSDVSSPPWHIAVKPTRQGFACNPAPH